MPCVYTNYIHYHVTHKTLGFVFKEYKAIKGEQLLMISKLLKHWIDTSTVLQTLTLSSTFHRRKSINQHHE